MKSSNNSHQRLIPDAPYSDMQSLKRDNLIWDIQPNKTTRRQMLRNLVGSAGILSTSLLFTPNRAEAAMGWGAVAGFTSAGIAGIALLYNLVHDSWTDEGELVDSEESANIYINNINVYDGGTLNIHADKVYIRTINGNDYYELRIHADDDNSIYALGNAAPPAINDMNQPFITERISNVQSCLSAWDSQALFYYETIK